MSFTENEIYESKEHSVLSKIRKVFKNQIMHKQNNGTKETKGEKTIKKAGFKIIRSNPDKEDFDIFDGISEIQDFIYESCKKLTKELSKKSLVELTEKLHIVAKQL